MIFQPGNGAHIEISNCYKVSHQSHHNALHSTWLEYTFKNTEICLSHIGLEIPWDFCSAPKLSACWKEIMLKVAERLLCKTRLHFICTNWKKNIQVCKIWQILQAVAFSPPKTPNHTHTLANETDTHTLEIFHAWNTAKDKHRFNMNKLLLLLLNPTYEKSLCTINLPYSGGEGNWRLLL